MSDNSSQKRSLFSVILKKAGIEHWHIIAFYLVLYDVVAVNFSYFLGLLLRFDLRFSSIPAIPEAAKDWKNPVFNWIPV